MKYSDWPNNRWVAEAKGGDNPSICIDYTITFTLKEIVNNLNGCLNTVRNHYGGNVSPEELEELVDCFREFVLDYQI